MNNTEESYTISEAATKLGISTKTLRRWEESGRFKGSRTIGGQRRYSTEDIQILDAIANNIIPSDQELLTINEAANLAGVSNNTIARWTEEGKLNTFITSSSRYYLRTMLQAAMKQNQVEEAKPEPPLVLTPIRTNIANNQAKKEFTRHDVKLIIINMITTATLLGTYHFLSISNQNPIPTAPSTTQIQGLTDSEDPKLNTIKNLFDQSGNFSTAGTMRVSGQLSATRLTLTPTTKPLSPSAGQLYFDASSQNLEIFNGQTWQVISQGSVPESTSSAQVTKSDTRLLLE